LLPLFYEIIIAMDKKRIFIGVLILLLAGCSSATPAPTATPQPPKVIPSDTPTSTPPPTATETLPPTITPTITLTPTATWVVAGPGEVEAPILMYHNVDTESLSARYNVVPEVFAVQMQALADWGYETITVKQLVAAITEGAPLPPRPIVITFDDGYYGVYENAFPIMQEHGFVGVAYIVANRLKSHGFMGVPQLDEMTAAGWEVGSHSYTHSDLTLNHSIAFDEIFYSRQALNEALTEEVTTFAYPFGAFDYYLGDRTRKWGYEAGMGLGRHYTHSKNTLFYLQRIEVQGGYNMEKFASLLPWTSPEE
jgi:peptidoglycan/xylan/chitin deacetylase (PgdA/CDA1 family)